MGLLYLFGNFPWKVHVLICSSLLQGRQAINTVYLPLVWLLEWFEWPSCGWSTYDGFYFPYCALWTRWEAVFVFLRSFVLVLLAIPVCWNLPFSCISVTSPSIWVLLSAPSNLGNPLCNVRGPYESDNISSYHVHWVMSGVVWAI